MGQQQSLNMEDLMLYIAVSGTVTYQTMSDTLSLHTLHGLQVQKPGSGNGF